MPKPTVNEACEQHKLFPFYAHITRMYLCSFMQKSGPFSEIELHLSPADAAVEAEVFRALCKGGGLTADQISDWRISRRSIDARRSPVRILLQIQYCTDGKLLPQDAFQPVYPKTLKEREVLIAGFGPAGIFAALELLEHGIRPVVLERGKMVRERRRDLAQLNRLGQVDPDSNYCFGEGGAGTYSDGKLYTRSKKRGQVNKVLDILIQHGASADIRINARPHIGTNKLPAIVENLRNSIREKGGEILFEAKITDIRMGEHGVEGVELNDGRFFAGRDLILATGHSARDIYELLHQKGIQLENKEFALGVRIEHPQEQIDRIQYHCDLRNAYLPPAYYNLVTQAKGRGVFSFCMCPGGIIAPASTDQNHLVVNGWSPSKRNGKFANSGMVVSVGPDDWKSWLREYGSLAALKFQEETEAKANIAGGGNLVAPAQRMTDFIEGRLSSSLPECSYVPGIRSADLSQVLPVAVTKALRDGLIQFGKKMKGYHSPDAVLVATESRTSSPVRIPRDPTNLQHPDVAGLYPCGEGAGYAGGIVSAAVDGMRCAQEAVRRMELETGVNQSS